METFDLARICALRMRAIMSPIGSLTPIAIPLPARFHEAGNQALGAEVAQRDTAETMLAVIAARATGELAAIANARGRGIARQFGKLEGSGETLLHRQRLIAGDLLELAATIGELLRHLAPPVILFDHTLLSHTFSSLFPRLRERNRPSLPEREVECSKQRARLFVVARACANGDVHAPGVGDLVEIDLREHDVFLDAEAVVAAAVEALRIESAEVADARQRDVHQPVDEVVHARLTQRYLAADGLTVAQLVGGDRLARHCDHGLLAGDQRQVGGGVVHLLAVGDTLADAHV